MNTKSPEISEELAKNTSEDACAFSDNDGEQNNSLPLRIFIIGTIFLLVISWGQELASFPFNHDNGIILDTSRRVLEGERLYTDIPEVNPPLIFILGMGVVLLSQVTGLHEILLWRLCFLLSTTLVILFSGHLIRISGWKFEDGRSQGFFWSIIALFFCYSGYDFSQREHLAVVFFLPYLLICFCRTYGKNVSKKSAAAAGFIAGLAFSLKPFFLLVFFLVEIYMLVALRETGQRWFRVESLIAVIFSGGFLFWVVIGTPYLSHIRFIAPYYASYNITIPRLLYNFNFVPFALASFLHVIFEPPKDEVRMRQLLFLTALGFGLAYLVQLKGFPYHSLPMRIFSWLLVSIIVLDLASAEKLGKAGIRKIAGQLSAKFYVFPVVFILFLSWLNVFYFGDEVVQKFINQIRELGAGKKVQLLTFNCYPAFPAFNYCGLQTTQRGSVSILVKLYHGKDTFDGPFPYKNGSDTWKLLQSYIDKTVEDIATRKPDYIFSEDHLFRQGIGKSRFNFIEFLMLDARFQSLFKNYQFFKEASDFKIFKRHTE